MNQKKIAALLILVQVTATGCSGLVLGSSTSNVETTTTGISQTTTPGETDSTGPVTVPETTSTTQPVDTKSPDEQLVEQWAGKIYPGILVSGFNLGGLTYAQAEEKLEKTRQLALARKISFTAGPNSYVLTQQELGVSFQYADALEKAKQAYSELSVSEKAQMIRQAPKLNIPLKKSIDEEALKALTKKVGDEINRKATTEVSGRRLYTITFRNAVAERIRFSTKDAESFKAKLEITPKLQPVSTRGTISKSYSWYDKKNLPRSFNIRRAARKIDGTVLSPGEVFSFNRTVGAASKRNGYKIAPVYGGGGMTEGYGGGVCQVSSTLYNAVVRAGLTLVERHTHAYSVLYLPYGMDATIYYPSLDFKFKNNLDYPITIRASASDGDLRYRFVADKLAMGGISYKFSQDVLWQGKEEWVKRYTSELKPGEVRIEYPPHPALEVNVYRTTYKNGKRVKREWFDNVSYRKLKGLKLVGKN